MRLRFCLMRTAVQIFVAKHPVTKPNLNVIRKHEKNLEEKIDELVQTALDTKELIVVEA